MRLLKSLLAAVLGMILFASACWIFRVPILREATRLWVVNEKPFKADAIVILGGEPQSRSIAATGLFSAGYAPVILILSPWPRPSDKMGITLRDAEITRKMLIALGVPATAIKDIGRNVLNTWDEAVNVREWMASNHADKLLVVSGLFQSRRALWLFRKELGGGDRVRIIPASPLTYDAANWWQNEQAVIEFQNELVKYPYYRLRHQGG